MKPQADWLGWTMQGVFGFLVGVAVGCYFLFRGRAGFGLHSGLMIPCLIGTGLIGAGLGARYGDRLWMGDNYRIIPPDEPEQSVLSDWLAWFLVAAGSATCVVVVLKQLGVV